MIHEQLSNMVQGWFVGDFTPSVLETNQFEAAIKDYEVGSLEPCHVHTLSDEYIVVISGHIRVKGTDVWENQIIVVEAGEETDLYVVEASKCLFLKTKGVNDRVWRTDTQKQLQKRWFNRRPAKIKVYIVTFKRNDVLNENLYSLWKSLGGKKNIDVTIIANHPDTVIMDENKRDNLHIIPNYTRSTNAWGNLSKDWNFALLDCFEHWSNPNHVDWCVLAQNDVKWLSGWVDYLENNDEFDFISQPAGDQAIAINIAALKKIGFFDERFTTLHFQEQDYFTRAIYYLGDRASINDGHWKNGLSDYNPVGNVLIETSQNYVNYNEPELHHYKTMKMQGDMLREKYGLKKANDIFERSKVQKYLKKIKISQTEINWYPFFWEGCEEIKKTFAYND